MPALDALHAKQIAYHDATSNPNWHRFMDTLTASMRGENRDTLRLTADYNETGPEVTRRLVRTLNAAHMFYVSPNMNRLVTAAAESWADDEPVFAEDFPTAHGWLFIPGGLATIDIRGKVLWTNALSWEVVGGGVDITMWAHKNNDPPEMRDLPGWADFPTYTPWHFVHVDFGDPLPRGISFGRVLPPEQSEQIRWVRREDGSYTLFSPVGYSPDELKDILVAKADTASAWVISALRIMQDPLIDVRPQGVPANVRKNLMRYPRRVKQTHVSVIEFRRREGPYEHTGTREFSHRFLRRGHWRRQPFKRDDGEWDRRRIWIHATIVGDPDKPLILREHVNALMR